MAETHELRLKINASGAKSGAREFNSALKAIERNVRKLERDASGVFLKLKKGLRDVNKANAKPNIGIDKQALRDIDSLAKKQASLAKSISTTATRGRDANKSIGLLARSYGRANTSGEKFMKTLRAQNSALLRQIQLVTQLRGQLSTLKGASAKVSVAGAGAAPVSRTPAAPKARSGTGTGSAAWMVEREMRSIAGAANAKDAAIRRATGGMRGLENAFSSTYQVGSAFRVMLGAITFGSFISSVYQAGDALDQFRVSMEIATGSTAGAMGELEYVDEIAMRLGVNLQSVRDNYSKFSIASDIAGVSADKTRKVFESVSTAMAVLGKSTQDQNLAFMALEQMMSKGKVSSEELRRQLGERLPGAVSMMAEALGVGVDELQKMLKAGAINSADALPKFADVLMKRFAPGVERASRRAGNNLQKLQTQITKFFEAVAQSGVMDELAYQFRILTDVLKAGAADGTAQKLGEAFTKMAEVGGTAVKWLIENFETLGAVIKALAIAGLINRVSLMGQAFATASTQLAGYIKVFADYKVNQRLAAVNTATHTAALTANTKASAANAYAQATLATGIGRVGKMAGVARGVMTALTRTLGVLGPAGAIISGILLAWPALFGKASQSASQMAVSVDAAVSRSGAKFDQLGETIRDTVTSSTFDRILADLAVLDRGLDEFVKKSSARRDGLLEASMLATGNDVRGWWRPNKDIKKAGIDLSATEGLTKGAKGAVGGIIDDYNALVEGQGNVLDLQHKIQKSMREFPSGIPLFQAWRDFLGDLTNIELASNANQDMLARTFGTKSEQQMLDFAEKAKSVLNNKMDLSELLAIKDNSNADAKVRAFMDAAVEQMYKSMRDGSPEQFMESMRAAWIDTTTTRMAKLEETANKARAAVVKEKQKFDELGITLTDTMSGDMVAPNGGASPFSKMGAFDAAIDGFDKWQDKIKTADGLTEALNRIQDTADDEGLKNYAQAVVLEFNQLPDAARNVDGLRTVMESLERDANAQGGTFSALRTALEQALSPSEMLAKALHALNLPASYDDDIEAMIASARAIEDNQNAAEGAQSALSEGARRLAEMGAEAAEAASKVTGLVTAIYNLQNMAGSIPNSVGSVIQDIERDAILASLAPTERKGQKLFWEKSDAAVREYNEGLKEANKLTGVAKTELTAELSANYNKAIAAARKGQADITAAARQAIKDHPAFKDPTKGSSRNKTDAQKYVDLMKQVSTDLDDLEIKADAYRMLTQGQFETAEAAENMAKAMAYSGGAVDAQTAALIRQADVAGRLNKDLSRLANDPVKDFVESSQSWVQASQTIEMDAIKSLSDTITDFVTTGKLDWQSLAQSMIASMARVLADKVVADFIGLFGKNSSGGGVGFIGQAVSFLFGAGSEGGYSESLPGRQAMPISAFKNAPHYKEGTPNTSNGIPSILHPNEAVVPLSRGRKIPVEMAGGGGGFAFSMGDINVNVEGGAGVDDEEGALRMANQISATIEGMIEEKMMEHTMYGGIMNPRGGY